jgi:hypothetical protein
MNFAMHSRQQSPETVSKNESKLKELATRLAPVLQYLQRQQSQYVVIALCWLHWPTDRISVGAGVDHLFQSSPQSLLTVVELSL